MIQELLGSGGGLIGGERRSVPFNGAHHGLEATLPPNNSHSHSSSSPSPSPSPSSSTALVPVPGTNSNTTGTKSASSNAENLRCPRCDSSNTKFCYYNNYNLTQPRHFCKTCRRYWTKGGALRNVPIGGGCRKNKSPSCVAPSSGGKSIANNKIKTMACEIGRSGFGSGLDHMYELPSSPILWAAPHQNGGSHLLSLLRAGTSQNPNPNHNPSLVLSSTSMKEEGGFMGAQILADPTLGTTGRAHGLDQLGQVPNPMWRTNQHQQNGGLAMADDQNSAFQQLYQRLRSSTGYYPETSSSPMLLNNAASSSSAALESASVGGGDHLGFWNPSFSWSDLPAVANGAYRY